MWLRWGVAETDLTGPYETSGDDDMLIVGVDHDTVEIENIERVNVVS